MMQCDLDAVKRSCFILADSDGQLDIVFLIDNSGSIRGERFRYILGFIVNITEQMEVT